MSSIFEKSKSLSSVYAQMLLVLIAFVIMVTSSFLFVKNIEQKQLARNVENAVRFTENEITTCLMEPETFLGGYSETIREMIINGESMELITSNVVKITNFLLKDEEYMSGFIGIYGFINGVYISGRNWSLPDNFVASERPWYKAAVEAEGRVALSDPYIDAVTKKYIITLSRELLDEGGRSLGVICIDMELNKINAYATNINFTDGSYGILLNNNFEVIAHPEPYFIGELLSSKDSGLAHLAEEMKQGYNISERKARNYMYENSIVFFTRIKYGWWLGFVIPINEYYRNIFQMAAFLIIIGCLLTVMLCYMLYRIFLAKRKADLKTQQKSNFLATMSHEIRTPLNAILGITEIQMQNASLSSATSEAFIKINNSGNLLLSIINDILDLSKIEAGKLELAPVKYEVASLINDIVQLNRIRYESKPIDFKLEVNENIPSILIGDELRIKQILNNLLSNAFKYTESGTVTLSANAECVGRGSAVLVTLIFQVADTGQGMTADQISKLFDENTRFNMEANRTTEGAGLGLTITRNLLELMQGRINVKSAVGEGTTVTVRLQQKTEGVGISGMIGKELAESLKQYKLGGAVQIKKSQITHEHMPYGHVLIVDDVETNLYVAKGLMAPYGLKIDLATSGFEAIEKIKNGIEYDIIFMDHMMPKMDGIETTKLIRGIGYTRPIVALTANALAGQAEMFLKNGFDGFISKPIDIRQLNVSLNRLIRDKQPVEVVEAAHRERIELDKKSGGGANPRMDSELAEIFARDAEKSVAVLESLLQKNLHDEEDIHMYVINVHAMKSALANIGENGLSAAALRLEQAGRENDISIITSETQNFLSELRTVIEKVKPKDDENAASEDTEEALVFLIKKLSVIREACAAFDKKAAKDALGELKEKTWSHNSKELLNKIAEHLLHSEFDSAAALADEYINIKK